MSDAPDSLSSCADIGAVANVVGLPGFTVTRPKWTVPFRFRSMTGLRRSDAPMEVPPVVNTRSARCRPNFNLSTCACTLEYALIVSELGSKQADEAPTYRQLYLGRRHGSPCYRGQHVATDDSYPIYRSTARLLLSHSWKMLSLVGLEARFLC